MPVTRRRAALGVGLLGLFALGAAVSPDAAVARARGLLSSPWFPLLLAAGYLVRPFLAWPITALSVLVGYRYGLLLGVPLALAGAVATSLIPYAAGRRADLGEGLLARAGTASERFFGTAGDLRGVVAARLAPTPAEAVSAGAGTAGVPVGAFALGTVLGELPWTVAAVAVGRSARSVDGLALSSATDPALVGGGVLAALLLLAGPAYRHVRERRAAA